ncbi:MAG: GHMP kinase [Candidatus Heimdallarchaeota archaeon]|nr:MAG: GHMP kinase [Candidatus Heimdallarchaeota archaeon]
MDLTIKAPGRIVLFGEHQDYLGLPVIPAAVDLYMTIKGRKANSTKFNIDLPDIQDRQVFSAINVTYQSSRDYLRSGVKVLQENGIIPDDEGASARITSDIPMQAGLSSSSALCVIWISFLAELFNNPLTPMEITKFAHRAEVLEFNEPGGMQDHMVIAHGYINFEEFDPIKCTPLLSRFPGIVIGNSLERKDTLTTLATIKNGVKRGLKYMGVSKVRELTIEDVKEIKPVEGLLDEFSLNALIAAVMNFEITKKAHSELKKPSNVRDEKYIGYLMNQHHTSLRDYIRISTPKIDKMIEAALKAGALGCKITGSGNGGCMIAFCPGHEESVSRALQQVGAQTHIAQVVSGVSKVNTN